MQQITTAKQLQQWFEQQVRLDGRPYTLDLDQAQAVLDDHKNTLVTARAGSGKTRVIVAKVAYLVASGQARLEEIQVFMFNRTAAAEVNQRIGAVEIDGTPLSRWGGQDRAVSVAATFHKFALDLVKATGEQPTIMSEAEQGRRLRHAFADALSARGLKLPLAKREEMLRLISSFITRAGQQFCGAAGLAELNAAVRNYCQKYANDPAYHERRQLHELALDCYQTYLKTLTYPLIDFNLLMAHAADLLRLSTQSDNSYLDPARYQLQLRRIANLKYILIDEYQDFSYLFFSLIQGIRRHCPAAHLFAVGDDWQAINRFAGSDVNYFIKFAEFFPDDMANIPLVTNYRSDRRIVERANRYMLENYDSEAKPAKPFSRQKGRIRRHNPSRVKFDAQDLLEDGFDDARFQLALAHATGTAANLHAEAARLLKAVYRIVRKHRREQIMLLHRHNFLSFAGLSLESFGQALRQILSAEAVLSADEFDRQVRCMTMHKSKGLESDVVILLELDRAQVRAAHPYATIFEIFGDTRAAEVADQHRLLYVALTRAKHQLYLLSSDQKPVA